MSSLDDLKKRMYKPDEGFDERKRQELALTQEKVDAPLEWEDAQKKFEAPEEIMLKSKEYIDLMKQGKRKKNVILFFSGAALALLAAFTLVYQFYIKGGGIGFLSAQNIDIKIDSAETLSAGENFPIPIVIKNNNKVDLENAEITLSYPEGAQFGNGDSPRASLKERRKIGRIPAGAEIKEIFQPVIFGEENSEHEIKASFEYRLNDSSAIFEKSATKKVVIVKPAITVFIEHPDEAGFGKEINFKINLISNTEKILKDIVLDIEYPNNFEFYNASPEPTSKYEPRWRLGDLLNGETKTINIRGKLDAKNFFPEETFSVSAGVLNENNNLIVYTKKIALIQVRKPFLNVSLKTGDDEGEHIAQKGENLKITLEWENNLPIGVKNTALEARINDPQGALDISSVSINNGGSYRSFDNTILWDFTNYPKLSYIESGEKGKVSFSVRVKRQISAEAGTGKNFNFNFETKFFTNYIPDEFKDIDISGNDSLSVKIVSNLEFAQKGFYSIGAFKNTGTVPPQAGKETTYTIKWSLVNSSNALSDVSVSAYLPNYVKWLNNVQSNSNLGEISYNEENREVKWFIKNLDAGAGYIRPAEEISFQILLLPAAPHIGTSPVLISKAESAGRDSFVNVNLTASQPAVTTQLSNDPAVGYGKGTVVKQ